MSVSIPIILNSTRAHADNLQEPGRFCCRLTTQRKTKTICGLVTSLITFPFAAATLKLFSAVRLPPPAFGGLFWPTQQPLQATHPAQVTGRGRKANTESMPAHPPLCISPLPPCLTLPKSLELAKSGHACLACWTDCARKENKTQMYTNSWWCQWRDS